MSKDYDINTATTDLIDKFIEHILEENYREIDGIHSDIRYVYYGDVNRFYDYRDNESHVFPVSTCTRILSECTCDNLERDIKGVVDSMVEFIKMSNCLPPMIYHSIVPPPLGYNDDLICKLCIYYYGSYIKGDSIEFNIGLGMVGSDEIKSER